LLRKEIHRLIIPRIFKKKTFYSLKKKGYKNTFDKSIDDDDNDDL